MTAEEIFFEEIDEIIAENFSDCSSFVEIIDGFGIFKLNEDKANWLRNVIIKALNKIYNQALEDYQKELIVNDNSVIGAFNKLKK